MNYTKTSSEKETTLDSKPKIENVKQFYRKKVWDYLEKSNLAAFPRPVYGRIPNFKGNDAAASKLLSLDEFRNSKSVEVNPDKPLEHARYIVLEHNKNLYVPLPKLENGLMKLFTLSQCSNVDIRKVVTRWGIDNLGHYVNICDSIYIDLLIVGSVAVSKEGYRIGKGKGYADLEFAILKEMKAVDDDTIIVTVVHDSQVFDTLPTEIFQKYDVPVDCIVTPSQIIRVDNKLPRPVGIYWDMLTHKRINDIPVLKKLQNR